MYLQTIHRDDAVHRRDMVGCGRICLTWWDVSISSHPKKEILLFVGFFHSFWIMTLVVTFRIILKKKNDDKFYDDNDDR